MNIWEIHPDALPENRNKKGGAGISEPLNFREEPLPTDPAGIREIVESSGFFHTAEIEVACELVLERLSKGIASGYHFLFAEERGRVVGYTCFGPIPCTQKSYDLYWIAVHNARRGEGVGRDLLTRTERIIMGMGGARIYVETSSRDLYQPTNAFYRASGYRIETTLMDFYAPGDGKVIFLKILPCL